MNNTEKKEIENRLEMFLKDKKLVQEYLGIYGFDLDIKNINSFKAQIKEKMESPLYEIKLICPICSTKLKGFEIKAKTMMTQYNWLYIPFFSSVGKIKKIDYNQYSVSVCPNCLFASHTKFEFNRESSFSSSSKIEKTTLNNDILVDIKFSKANRLEIIDYKDEIKNSFGKYPRDYYISILSYKLALEKNRAEIKNYAKDAYLTNANYHLRLAKLYLKANESEELINKAYEDALNGFIEAFKLSNFSKFENELKNLFQLTALLLFLKRDKEAMDYRNFMKKILEETPDENKPLATKWEKHFQKLIDYKDMVVDFNNIMELT